MPRLGGDLCARPSILLQPIRRYAYTYRYIYFAYTVRYTVLHARRGYVPLQSFYVKMKNVAMNTAVEERQKVLVAFTFKTQNIKRLSAAFRICKIMNRNI